MPVDLDKLFLGFCDESQDHLAFIEQGLMEIDLTQPDLEEINAVFRAAHSIKGGAGVFSLDALIEVTHLMENLLDMARNGDIQLTHEIINVLLEGNDVLSDFLQSYQKQELINEDLKSSIIEKLKVCLQSVQSQPQTPDSEGCAIPPKPSHDNGSTNIESEPDSEDRDQAFENDPTLSFGFAQSESEKGAEPQNSQDSFGFFDSPQASPVSEGDNFGFFDEAVAKSDASTPENDSFGFFEPEIGREVEPAQPYGFFDKQSKPLPQSELIKQKVERGNFGNKDTARTKRESSSIRVDTNKVDALVNLVGELVITQSILQVISGEVEGQVKSKLQSAITDLKRNTREIQDATMSMRMLPLSTTFDRFPRVVRDLSNQLGKKLELLVEGGATEIDKGMIEKLVDPLTHLVRNSIDHGIEYSEQRLAAGKSETGQITLSAEQRGSCIVISVIDDGAGLDRERILAKAEEKGIPCSCDMTDAQVWELIFAPGFSTASQVTNVSGRGVGMDVVRRNIESIGGRIDIDSHPGKGSAFHIELPLTLAILDGMCVQVGSQVFVIPLSNIIESLQPSETQLKDISNDKLLWIREEYWPLIELGNYMQVGEVKMSAHEGVVVLVQSNKKRFGLVVNALLGQQQVVIKSLEKHFKKVTGIAGATIMGDGSVALILDIESLAESNALTTQQEALCG